MIVAADDIRDDDDDYHLISSRAYTDRYADWHPMSSDAQATYYWAVRLTVSFRRDKQCWILEASSNHAYMNECRPLDAR